MNRHEKNSDDKNAIDLFDSLSTMKYAHFSLPGNVKSISEVLIIRLTAGVCKIWSLAPSPVIIPVLTVSLACANRLNDSIAGLFSGKEAISFITSSLPNLASCLYTVPKCFSVPAFVL